MAPPSDSILSSGANGTHKSLLEGLKDRRDRAWDDLARLYAPLVYFWCRRDGVAEQDIPDVVQDVFRGVVAGIDTFRKERNSGTFRGWLRIITRNSLIDYFRKMSRNPAAIGGSEAHRRIEQIAEQTDAGCEEEATAEQALFMRALDSIRDQFDPQTWQAFWRVVVDGLSAAQVGTELGMKPGTVRVAKSRVLQRLRCLLGDIA
jgi:RNA polymerase sigma-70 factor (ECF subfamily)